MAFLKFKIPSICKSKAPEVFIMLYKELNKNKIFVEKGDWKDY